MTKLGCLLTTMALTYGLAGTGVPAAQAQPETECTVTDMVAELTPGLSEQPSRGSFYSTSPGKVTCDGPVQGITPTGPGEYTTAGRIGTQDPDTCTSGGEGWGVNRVEFPTASGTKVLRSAFTLTYGGDQLLSGEFEGDYTSGTFDLIRPTKGDCVREPVTEGTFDLTMTVHEYRGPKA